MKRVISFALVLCLLIPFGTGALAAEANWEVSYYVDDFGDPTDNAYLRGVFSGTFSNTATSSSPLTVVVYYNLDYAVFSFRLLEYDDVPATYTSSEAENIVFKIKTADGVISEGTLSGSEPNGDLFLRNSLPVCDKVLDALQKGEDVRCIIEFSRSKYNFTMAGVDFPDCLTELEEIKYAPVYAAAEELLAAGDYDGAIAAFQTLGDYKDSAARAEEAAEAKCAPAYAAAEELLAAGDKLGAAKAFGEVGDYSDAWERCFDLWGELTERNAVSSSGMHTVTIQADGTVMATGINGDGQCNVDDWTDIASVSAGYFFTVGLRSDGSVVATGYNGDLNGNHGGQCDVDNWTGIVAVSAGANHTVGLRYDGTVVATGSNDYGECDLDGWTDIVSVSAGVYRTSGVQADGTTVVAGKQQGD